STSATLASGNYSISGLQSTDTFSVGQTSGTYTSKNVTANGGTVLVTSGTLAGNFSTSNSDITNYNVTNATATGNVGSITAAPLTVSLTGTVQKTYDGTNTATLASGNYTISNGLVGGETFTVSGQTSGTYTSRNVTANTGTGVVTSGNLSSGNFTGGSGGVI